MLFSATKKRLEAEALSDEIKRKISEAHLAIKSGLLTDAQLAQLQEKLQDLRRQLRSQCAKVGVFPEPGSEPCPPAPPAPQKP